MSEMLIPAVEEVTVNGVREISLMTNQLKKRRMFIGEINSDLLNIFLPAYMYLAEQSDEPITLYINSPGGSVKDGLAMIDIIDSAEIPINTVCCGMAASMASVILAAGKKRYILPHSKVMIHEPRLYNEGMQTASSVEETAKRILETREVVNEIIASRCNKTIEEINEKTKTDYFMTAQEALEFGIVDEIIPGPFIK